MEDASSGEIPTGATKVKEDGELGQQWTLWDSALKSSRCLFSAIDPRLDFVAGTVAGAAGLIVGQPLDTSEETHRVSVWTSADGCGQSRSAFNRLNSLASIDRRAAHSVSSKGAKRREHHAEGLVAVVGIIRDESVGSTARITHAGDAE